MQSVNDKFADKKIAQYKKKYDAARDFQMNKNTNISILNIATKFNINYGYLRKHIKDATVKVSSLKDAIQALEMVKKYKINGIAYNNISKIIYCKFCNIDIYFWREDLVLQHLNTKQHLDLAGM
jgi:hypothetical protein